METSWRYKLKKMLIEFEAGKKSIDDIETFVNILLKTSSDDSQSPRSACYAENCGHSEVQGFTQEQLNAIYYAINTWLENDTRIISTTGEELKDAIIDKKPDSKTFIDRLKYIAGLSNFSE